jgi:hypothetical protein
VAAIGPGLGAHYAITPPSQYDPNAGIEQQILTFRKEFDPNRPKGQVVTTVGPDGKTPVEQYATAEDLQKGVPKYVAPTHQGLQQALDTTTKKPVFVSAEAIAAEPGRYQPMRTGVNVNVGGENSGDVKAVVAGMKAGRLPPQLPGRATKEYVALMAEAERQGFDLSRAATDWVATQKHVATLNGSQQTRLRQAVDTATHSLDVIEDLAKKWQGGRFPILNRGRLKAALEGTLGPDAQAIATKLEAQISDVTSELGNVYMGGNSPTDHALQLAAKNLSADWSLPQLQAALDLSRTNLKIRANSMVNVGVAGASADNPYDQPAPTAAAAPGKQIKVGKYTVEVE